LAFQISKIYCLLKLHHFLPRFLRIKNNRQPQFMNNSIKYIFRRMSRQTWEFSLRSKTTISWHRGVLKGARPPFSEARTSPLGQMRKNCVKKRYFGVKSDAARSFFFFSRTATPIWKKEARSYGVVAKAWRGAGKFSRDSGRSSFDTHIREARGICVSCIFTGIFVNRRVPWRGKKTGEEAIHPKKLKTGRLRRVRNG